jgi:hypothetical protein
MCKVTMSVLSTDNVKISLSINLNRESCPVNRNKHYSIINEALSGHLTTTYYFELLKNTNVFSFINIS